MPDCEVPSVKELWAILQQQQAELERLRLLVAEAPHNQRRFPPRGSGISRAGLIRGAAWGAAGMVGVYMVNTGEAAASTINTNFVATGVRRGIGFDADVRNGKGQPIFNEGVVAAGIAGGIKGATDDGTGVAGFAYRSGIGVYGYGFSGVQGIAQNAVAPSSLPPVGVFGSGSDGTGLGKVGVQGLSDSNDGVFGVSSTGPGVHGSSGHGAGVVGESARGDGVLGTTNGHNGAGVAGIHAGSGTGVSGLSNSGSGVSGQSSAASGTGVLGQNTDAGNGVAGYSQGNGVYGSSNGSSYAGVSGSNDSGGYGLFGQSSGGFGVAGVTDDPNHAAVAANNSGGGRAVLGTSTGDAVTGESSGSGIGVVGTSAFGHGVSGESGDSGSGLYGRSRNGNGVFGVSQGAAPGVFGTSDHQGVYGESRLGRGGVFTGHAAAVRLVPSDGNGPPSTGSEGDLYVDRKRRLWFCRGPSNWKRIA